jgi:hypothetical protein
VRASERAIQAVPDGGPLSSSIESVDLSAWSSARLGSRSSWRRALRPELGSSRNLTGPDTPPCVRGPASRLKSRAEWRKPGVYLLIGEGPIDAMPKVYIGEGDPVGDRLVQHDRNRDWWSQVVFFTSKDDNLNKAHVQYLESRLVRLAREAKRCELENGNTPTEPSLSEADIAEMEEFLGQMILVYPAMGITVFQKAAAPTLATRLFFLHAKGLSATGYEAPDGFVVREGGKLNAIRNRQ